MPGSKFGHDLFHSAPRLGAATPPPAASPTSAASASGGQTGGLPPGRIVRLPPSEQAVRPELQQKLDTNSSASEPKTANGGSSSSFKRFKLR